MRFTLEAERDRALTETNGVILGTRAIRVSLATAKQPRPGGPMGGGYPPPPGGGSFGGGGGGFGGGNPDDPNNTTLFVGGISPMVSCLFN